MSGTIALGVHPSLTERMVGTPEQVLALGVLFWRSTRRLSRVVGSSRSLVLNLLQGRIEA